jgi:hypothetical protein
MTVLSMQRGSPSIVRYIKDYLVIGCTNDGNLPMNMYLVWVSEIESYVCGSITHKEHWALVSGQSPTRRAEGK